MGGLTDILNKVFSTTSHNDKCYDRVKEFIRKKHREGLLKLIGRKNVKGRTQNIYSIVYSDLKKW